MTENNPIDIRHLSNLAKLKLTEAEAGAVAGDLARIIAMVDQMAGIDTEGVAPLAHPLDSHARMRSDAVTEAVDRALYQRGAPSTEDGLYLVPRVIE
ncbi:MAG: Asp-tRNA(Asn)/Glu-tRNA(Gln) amidotransferase subunit GatC [Pseudomonadales bacterium]